MDTGKSALVLTGNILSGHDAEIVWPALAQYFRMERDVFDRQVFDRLPMIIKESDDLAKLEKLRDGANAVGAQADVSPLDGTNLFILPADTPRGPLPRAWVAERVQSGEYPASLRIAVVGSDNWTTWDQLGAATAPSDEQVAEQPTPRPAPLTPQATDTNSTYVMPRVDAAALASGAAANDGHAPVEAPTGAAPLPPGGAIHAGFWRRCAALMLDWLILLIPIMLLNWLVARSGSTIVGNLVVIAAVWLYFALMEASPMQATFGKQIMGIKVTDDAGARIGFGRATGRYFGKIISSVIFGIGYMLAGWTARKQALHDMMASCCVVFRGVQPGAPLPTERPPMPWYGWVLNILPFVAIGVFIWFMAAMMSFILSAFGT